MHRAVWVLKVMVKNTEAAIEAIGEINWESAISSGSGR